MANPQRLGTAWLTALRSAALVVPSAIIPIERNILLNFGLWYYLLLSLQRGTKHALQAEYAARGEVFDLSAGPS